MDEYDLGCFSDSDDECEDVTVLPELSTRARNHCDLFMREVVVAVNIAVSSSVSPFIEILYLCAAN